MIRKAHNTYKTKKLIKVYLEYEEHDDYEENRKIISSVRITGDFFLYPEDSLDDLEKELRGTRLNKDELKKKVDESLSNSEVFGFDSESLADAILGCLTNVHEHEK